MLSKYQCRTDRRVTINPECRAAVAKACTASDTKERLIIGAGGKTIPLEVFSKLLHSVGVIVSPSADREMALVAWDEWANGIWVRSEYLAPVKLSRKKEGTT